MDNSGNDLSDDNLSDGSPLSLDSDHEIYHYGRTSSNETLIIESDYTDAFWLT